MQTSIVKWANIHENGDLWFQHLQIRKMLFVDHMGWDIPHNDTAEWDQYDTASTVYVITHLAGRVLAASRAIPCNSSFGPWSYMLRDASKGLLPGIPDDIIDNPPTDCGTWEATRFAADPRLSAEMRNECLAANARALAAASKDSGANRLIALMPPAYIRWLSSVGLPSTRLGPTRKDAEGSRICAIQMDLETLPH